LPDPSGTQVVENIQTLLNQARGMSRGWEQTIRETLTALTEKSEETLWPRDTLFRYLQLMESLQENMREYQELQMMASTLFSLTFYKCISWNFPPPPLPKKTHFH
jgi:cation channel sperm-associated protein 2